MSSILSDKFSTVNMLNFLDSLETTDSTDSIDKSSLYLVLGKNTEWNAAETPTDPTSTETAINDFRTNAMCLIRLNPVQDIVPVVPLNKWAAGKTYSTLSAHSSAANGIRNTDWYCLASNEATGTNNVYQCMTGGTTTAGNMPTKIEDRNTTFTTGDNLAWKFLYNLNESIIENGFLVTSTTPGWLPIPYYLNASDDNGYVTSKQKSNGDVLAPLTLGCNHLMVKCAVTDALAASLNKLSTNTEGYDFYTTTYRQIGLVWEPRAKWNSDADTTEKATETWISGLGQILHGDYYLWNDIDTTSGSIIYLENRTPITRVRNQTETLKLIIGF